MNQSQFTETSTWDLNDPATLTKLYSLNSEAVASHSTERPFFDQDCFRLSHPPQIRNYMEDGPQLKMMSDEDLQWCPQNKRIKLSYKTDTPLRQNSLEDLSLSRQGSARQAYTAKSSQSPDTLDPQLLLKKPAISKETRFLVKQDEAGSGHSLSFRKNSLKFCRRLSKSMIILLHNTDNELHNSVFRVFSQMVKTQACSQRVLIRSTSLFGEMHRAILTKIWSRYRNVFSNYKNNKICLVTFNEWQQVFSIEGFCKEFNSTSTCVKLIKEAVDFKDQNDADAFTDFYRRLLFTLSKLLANMVFYREMMNDHEFTQRTSNAEDFALMINSPRIYKHYNHSKGKFALECCNRCKICRSGSLPSNFTEQLTEARKKMEFASKLELLGLLKVGSDKADDEIIALFSTLLTAS